MSKRTVSQQEGSLGQRFIQYIFENQGEWIIRGQEEDYGIDLEAELAPEDVEGYIIKLQVKTSQSVRIVKKSVAVRITRSMLKYASSCRIPIVLIAIDLGQRQAWYLWLQEWLVNLHRSGKSLASIGKTVTVHIPIDHTLQSGLDNRLKRIARWETDIQLVLSLTDTLRTAVSVGSESVMTSLTGILEQVDRTFQDFPVETLIDEVIRLGPRIWGTLEGYQISKPLYTFCREFGNRFSTDHIRRLVIRGNTYSRTGINALGLLYDNFPEHIASLNLIKKLGKEADPRVIYYCRLRERYLGKKSIELLASSTDFTIGDLTLDPKILSWLHDRWANRGDSAFLDYVIQKT